MIIEEQLHFFIPLKNTKLLSPTESSYTSSHSPKLAELNSSSPSEVAKVVTIVAPVALAIFLKSCLSTLLNPNTFPSSKYFYAISSIALVVNITFAPAFIIFSHLSFKISHSLNLIFSRFFGSVTKTYIPICNLNLFKLKSRQAIFAFSTFVLISCDARIVYSAYPFTSTLWREDYP